METLLFYTYNRLFPGKADVIRNAIKEARELGAKHGMKGKEYQDFMEYMIMDAVDP